jgi:hypothetical protein
MEFRIQEPEFRIKTRNPPMNIDSVAFGCLLAPCLDRYSYLLSPVF